MFTTSLIAPLFFCPGNTEWKMPKQFSKYMQENEYFTLPENFRKTIASDTYRPRFLRLLKAKLHINQISSDTVPLLETIIKENKSVDFALIISEKHGNSFDWVLQTSSSNFTAMYAKQDIIELPKNQIMLKEIHKKLDNFNNNEDGINELSPEDLLTRLYSPSDLIQPIENNIEPSHGTSFLDVFKATSYLALPMAASFTFSFEVFLSVLLLQQLSESEEDIAAATLVSTVMNTICVIALAPLLGIALYLSEELGAWKKAEKENLNEENQELLIQEGNGIDIIAENIASEPEPVITRTRRIDIIESTNMHSLIIATTMAIPATAILCYAEPILLSFNQDPIVARSASDFLQTYALSVPGFALRGSAEQIMFGFGKTIPAMVMALSGFVVGGLFALALGFGVESNTMVPISIPRMRQQGVALGFLIETYITAIAFSAFIKFDEDCKKFNFYSFLYDFRQRLERNWSGLIELWSSGWKIGGVICAELLFTLSIGLLSGGLGTESQSAMAYCMQFIYFEFILIAAFGLSCGQMVSKLLGEQKLEHARATAQYGALTTLGYVTITSVIAATSTEIAANFFGGASEEVATMLTTLVPIMSLGVVLDSVRYNFLHQLRAMKIFNMPGFITVAGMLGGFCLAAALGFETPLGVNGLAIGYTAGIGTVSLALLKLWLEELEKLSDQNEQASQIIEVVENQDGEPEEHSLERVVKIEDLTTSINRLLNLEEEPTGDEDTLCPEALKAFEKDAAFGDDYDDDPDRDPFDEFDGVVVSTY